ncbi:MAG: acetamidase/formamidase family protein [Chloroflexota bacterium]|nr:acetamidase/formamidase family protein [Chloroflexota bacterium]MDE2910899.1 acetamidase/formamidase family protein [Chloroflexota bacterium]
MTEHFLDDSVTQPFWDNSIEPRLEIESGDVVVFDCQEPNGQIKPDWTVADYEKVDRSKIHALNGSVWVKGAESGDALEIDILDLQHKGWGWSAHRAGIGLLAEDFEYAYFHQWRIADETIRSTELDHISLPYEPHTGVVGVAPREAGRFSTFPPRENGGNMDVRDMTIGSTIWLPVLVEGALFATGDCHAAQGQGEVCVTGIEAPMTVTMRFKLRKGLNLPEAQLRRPSPMSKLDTGGYHITTAQGPDLMLNAKNAVRYMIDWLEANHCMNRSQAYILCSVAGDLKISSIVAAPNWVVSFHMPLAVFR